MRSFRSLSERSESKRSRRALTAGSLVLVLAVGVVVSAAAIPPDLALERRIIAQALAAADAAQSTPSPAPEPTPSPTESTASAPTTPTPVPAPPVDPVATGTLEPGTATSVTADDLAAEVAFSGRTIDEPLTIEVAALPAQDAASAGAQTGATVVGDPIQVEATTGAGAQVTDFPAEADLVERDGIQVVETVHPGVALTLGVDDEDIEGLDPASLRIVTREGPEEPWVEIPSFYDEAAGAVVGEIDHLSQFAVIGVPYVPPPGPRIVLDPDDNVGFTVGPNGPAEELPLNVALANQMAGYLGSLCLAEVLVTRPVASPDFLSAGVRAGMAASHNPDITVTVAFNALYGVSWGVDPDEGGTLVYSRGGGPDNALAASVAGTLPTWTGRPARVDGSPSYPYDDFDGVPGAMVHVETLFMDNNFDRAVIDSGFAQIAAGMSVSLGAYASTLGFDCATPEQAGLPSKPSAATLAAWKQLGYHYHQTYAGDPVSVSTGNLVEDEPLFTLDGPGTSAVDLTLVYNSQDGRESRVGTGWSFAFGSRAQRFDDGSVMVVRGDGASVVFEADGTGGFTSDADVHETLAEVGGGRLAYTDRSGTVFVFDAADVEGIGELVSITDTDSNTVTLTYGAPDADDRFVPLTAITDAAGRVIAVGTDAAGRIASFTHPDGRVWQLGYNATGDLVSITGPDARVRTFTYDADHFMLTAIDAAGVTYLVNEFDASGRVVKQWDADGNEREWAYTGALMTGGSTVYTDNEGRDTTYEWDESGRITSITDAEGGVEAFEYDAAGNPTAHIDPEGRETTYEHDADGNVTAETAPDGGRLEYTYGANGAIASITDAGGPDGAARTVTVALTATGRPVSVTLADGGTIGYAYTATGDVASVTDQAGNVTSFVYDAAGNITGTVNALGHTTTIAYDTAGRPVSVTDPSGATTTSTYDAGDRLVSTTDANGATTSFDYDALDRLVSVTDAAGATTSYEWDDLFRLTSVTNALGAVTTYEYDSEDDLVSVTDAAGNVTELTRDEVGRVTAVTDPLGAVWESVYDASGLVTETRDPLGATTTFGYDEAGRLTTVTDASGATTTTTYDEVGRTSTVTDALGNRIGYAYTPTDLVAAVVDAESFTVRNTYDAVGNRTGLIDRRGNTWATAFDALGRVVSETDPKGAVTAYAYDDAARTVTTTTALGAATTALFDAVGNLTTVTNPLGAVSAFEYDPLGRVTATIDALGAETAYAYDSLGQLTSSTDPLGAVDSFTYDDLGRVVTATDPLGVVTGYSYDAAGQLTRVVENQVPTPATQTGPDVNVTTAYAYTATGQLASMTNPLGALTRWEYDNRGLPVTEVSPTGGVARTTYDALGRPTAATDATGATTRTAYTPRGDIASIAYPDGVSVGFRYDADQQPIVMTDALGATGWTWDAAANLTSQTDASGARISYGVDAVGQVVSTTTPLGTVTNTFDAAGNQTAVTSPWGSASFGFDANGRMTGVTRSNGITTANTFDAAGQVTSIVHQTPQLPDPVSSIASSVQAWDGEYMLPGDAGACMAAADVQALDTEAATETPVVVTDYLDSRRDPGTDLSGCVKTGVYADRRGLPDRDLPMAAGGQIAYAYSYTAAGSLATQTATVGDTKTWTGYGYDALNRLTSSISTDGAVNAYGWDAAGNRTAWNTTKAPDTGEPLSVGAAYNAAGALVAENRARIDGTMSLRYSLDADGRRTSMMVTDPDGDAASTAYAYTGAGQLREVTTDIETVTYGYDGLGRNAETVTDLGGPEIATWTWWDGDTAAGITSTQGVDAGIVTDPVGQVLLQSGAPGAASSSAAWLLQDVRSSTTATATGQGRVTDVTGYSDFGTPTLPTEGWAAVASFTGKASATSEGLGQFPARTYDPLAGSWLTADPYRGSIADPATLNRYAYVTGDPATLIDPTGNAGKSSALHDGGGGKSAGKTMAPKSAKQLADGGSGGGVPGAGDGSPRGRSQPQNRHLNDAPTLRQGLDVLPDWDRVNWLLLGAAQIPRVLSLMFVGSACWLMGAGQGAALGIPYSAQGATLCGAFGGAVGSVVGGVTGYWTGIALGESERLAQQRAERSAVIGAATGAAAAVGMYTTGGVIGFAYRKASEAVMAVEASILGSVVNLLVPVVVPGWLIPDQRCTPSAPVNDCPFTA